jgi:hypothetical protein
MDSLYNGLLWIMRKTLMVDNILMKVISEKVTAASSSMTIINCEKRRLNSVFVNV